MHKSSQVAGLIQKVSRSSSEVSSLRAVVLRAAVFHSKIVAFIIMFVDAHANLNMCIYGSTGGTRSTNEEGLV